MLLVPSFTGFGPLPNDVTTRKHGAHTQNHAMQLRGDRNGWHEVMQQRAREDAEKRAVHQRAREADEKRTKLQASKEAQHMESLVENHGSDDGSESLEQIEAELTGSLASYFENIEAELTGSLTTYLAEMESDVERPPFEVAAASNVGDVGAAAAFEAAVQLCEAYERGPKDGPLSPDVPALLRRTFDADFAALSLRERATQNVTCMQPRDEGHGSELFDDELKALPLKPGRVCEGGACSEACSRVYFPAFLTPAEAVEFRTEIGAAITPPAHHFELAK